MGSLSRFNLRLLGHSQTLYEKQTLKSFVWPRDFLSTTLLGLAKVIFQNWHVKAGDALHLMLSCKLLMWVF